MSRRKNAGQGNAVYLPDNTHFMSFKCVCVDTETVNTTERAIADFEFGSDVVPLSQTDELSISCLGLKLHV